MLLVIAQSPCVLESESAGQNGKLFHSLPPHSLSFYLALSPSIYLSVSLHFYLSICVPMSVRVCVYCVCAVMGVFGSPYSRPLSLPPFPFLLSLFTLRPRIYLSLPLHPPFAAHDRGARASMAAGLRALLDKVCLSLRSLAARFTS